MMEKKKKLLVKAAVCDTRQVSESTLAAYEKVTIWCGLLLANRESRDLLGRCGVEIKAAQAMDMEDDVRVTSINGKFDIRPGQPVPAEKSYLIVNGRLDIAPGSEAQVKGYAGMTVNGKIFCPESMAPLLSNVNLNGKLETYPDGAVLLKGTAVLDRTFRLRAREGALYHAARRVVALAPDIGFEALAEKNVRFSTQELFVAESLAEAAVPLFGDQTDIQILPDGCALVNDSAVLDEALLRRFGGKLYVRGDLVLPGGCAPLLKQISYLRVEGTLLAARGLEDAVHSLDAVYESLCIVGGTLLIDRVDVTVSRAALEQAEDGLSVRDCVNVRFDPDVPADLIRERLVSLTDCVTVTCTPEQRAAIEAVARDVTNLGAGTDRADPADAEDTARIQAALYAL